MEFRWTKYTAMKVARRFNAADDILTGRNPGDAIMAKYRKACDICDWVCERYDIDINDVKPTNAETRQWPSRLLDSIIDIASHRIHPMYVREGVLHKVFIPPKRVAEALLSNAESV